jgi:hypothetical protein
MKTMEEYMAGQRAKYAAKDAADNAREDALLHWEANQRAAGPGAARPAEWVPQRSALDLAVRQALGREDAEAPADTSPVRFGMSDYKRAAWDSFSDAEQLSIRDDHDPELSLEYERRYHAAITGEQPEEEA